jgi:hypothetical protein
MNKMVSALTQTVAIAGENKNIQAIIGNLNPLGHGQGPAV